SYFFFQAEDGIRDKLVTGVQTCALPISIFAPLEADRRTVDPYLDRLVAAYRRYNLAAGNGFVARALRLRSEVHIRNTRPLRAGRSEERRVGKECGSRWWREVLEKKESGR